MPSAANALKLHDYYTHRRSGGLALAIGLAVVVSFVATTSFMIYLCYDYGGEQFALVVFQCRWRRGRPGVRLGRRADAQSCVRRLGQARFGW